MEINNLMFVKMNIEEVKLLLNNRRIDANAVSQKLYIACYFGKTGVVKLFLKDERVNVNKGANNNGQTPFWIACFEGQIEVVKLLLNDKRVDINKANKYDWTPFFVACLESQNEIVKLLLKDDRIEINKAADNSWTPFHVACYEGHIDIVKLLLNDERIDINKASNDSETPFVVACEKGHIEMVKHLLASGRELKGKNVIEVARKNKRVEIVELLESFQKDPYQTRFILRMQLGFGGKYLFI